MESDRKPVKPAITRGGASIYPGDFLDASPGWPEPTVIVSDGPYGVGSFPGDPRSPEKLPGWYEAHVARWSERANPKTTLWFWNTEIGWATVHPLLQSAGWSYRSCNIWDKGIAHIAGNANTKTLRRFPPVTEVCVQYEREPLIALPHAAVKLRSWLRGEWLRTGLPLSRANEACGVRDAASRKYLTKDDVWYMPPSEAVRKMAEYANRHGKPEGRPYFNSPETGGEPKGETRAVFLERSKFHCPAGVTNVWREKPVRGKERVKRNGQVLHMNQKPLALMELIIRVSSDPGDTVWEPFGGLCTAALAAANLGRTCHSAEIREDYLGAAVDRLREHPLPE